MELLATEYFKIVEEGNIENIVFQTEIFMQLHKLKIIYKTIQPCLETIFHS